MENNGGDGKRKRELSKKYHGFVIDKRSINSYCPGCNEYVDFNEKAVVCATCVAYWHYGCAKVSDEDVEKLGTDEFFCSAHSSCSSEEALDLVRVIKDNNRYDDKDEAMANNYVLVSTVKMLPFVLNDSELCKKRLKWLSSKFKVMKKDKGKQFTVKVNTVTYALIINGIAAMGESKGLKIRREDIDSNGSKLQVIFQLVINKDGLEVSVTMTCYHTTNNILVQMNGLCSDDRWNDKLKVVDCFVNKTIVDMIMKVEKMKDYPLLRESIRQELVHEKVVVDNDTVENGNNCMMNIPAQILVPWVGRTQTGGNSKDNGEEEQLLNSLNPNIAEAEVNTTENKDIDSTDSIASVETLVTSGGNDDDESGSKAKETPDNTNMCASTTTTEVCIDSMAYQSNNKDKLQDPEVITVSDEVANMGIVDVVNSAKIKDSSINSSALVVQNRAHDMKKFYKAFEVIRGFNSTDKERMECLYNIIIKLKQKNYEIKMENIQFVHPIATSQINQLALKLVQKQNECDDFKKKCNELEVQVKDMKKEKLDEEYIRKQKCKEETEQKMIESENVERDTKRMADRIDELTKNVQIWKEMKNRMERLLPSWKML